MQVVAHLPCRRQLCSRAAPGAGQAPDDPDLVALRRGRRLPQARAQQVGRERDPPQPPAELAMTAMPRLDQRNGGFDEPQGIAVIGGGHVEADDAKRAAAPQRVERFRIRSSSQCAGKHCRICNGTRRWLA